MAPAHTENIKRLLAGHGSLAATDIARLARISQPTFSRAIRGDREILRIGMARNSRYALARSIVGVTSSWSFYSIDDIGKASRMGRLQALQQGEFYFEFEMEGDSFSYLRIGEGHPSLYPDLPWFLDDMRPQGYMGRIFAHSYGPQLGIGTDPESWSVDETLVAILKFGSDTPGNFVLGDDAIDTFQAHKLKPAFIDQNERAAQYDILARKIAEDGELPLSSAGGEQPKFTTCIRLADGSFKHVIVKFSGSIKTSVGRRWADLLRSEALAGRTLRQHGRADTVSNIIETDQRIYLEVERFDRAGQFGRRGTISLRTLLAATGGRLDQSWRHSAETLAIEGWISEEDATRLTELEWFGHLIGNTDMHPGNICLQLTAQMPLSLCPAYDMLPMHYAPNRSGDVPTKPIDPVLPRPESMPLWRPMAKAAINFWREISENEQYTDQYRLIAEENHRTVENMARTL